MTVENLLERLKTSMQRPTTDAAALNEKLAARARMLGARTATDASAQATVSFLAFNKGRQHFGIPLADVVEVQALEFLTPVPKTPPFIVGVIHWRGAVLALLDLGKLLGIAESGLADVHVCIVVEAAGRRVAIAALEVEDILVVPLSAVRPLPELPGNTPAEFVSGACGEHVLLKMDAILHDDRLTSGTQA